MQDLADLMGNNGNMWDHCNVITGTFKFNGYPTFDEWNRQFEGYCGMGSEQEATAIMIIFLYGHPAILISMEHVHGKKKQMQSQMQNTL